jgi:hypothetical protein
MKIILRECTGEHRKWTGRTESGVIQRVYGKGAYFIQNYGLPAGYGQIVKDLPNRGNGWSATVLAAHVRIDTVQS